ncbi:MAG: AtpZ/AtpI family protein [Planctomycetota bacterium]|jgi:ATP synthase protein I|nr:AtpZ/AtpI family protein [Planctomycetota bacterium]
MEDESRKDYASPDAQPETVLARKVGVRASQKLRAKRLARRNVWWGMGMMGMVGWSVAAPTLAGALLGRWLDHSSQPGGRSWTLALLAAGLAIGCMNAWRWVTKENKTNKDIGEDEK